MKVVSNSSPLCYLVLIEQVHLLPALFGNIVIPEAVFRELSDLRAPEKVRKWLQGRPDWLDIRPVIVDPAFPQQRLHPGEEEAIALARQLEADLILIDEKAARRIARELGLNVSGLLAVLDIAGSRRMVNLLTAFERLHQTSFRVSPNLLKSILVKHFDLQ